MINKILIGNSKIEGDTSRIKINGNKITFLKDGRYLIEYVSSGEYNLIFNINSNIEILESSFDNDININNTYVVNGNLVINKFYNNGIVNEIINIDLCSIGSSVDYNFNNICRQEEYYEININHKEKNTISNINNKSVALDNSRLKFIINSNVSDSSFKSVLSQNTRIVTMGECETSISPNMFIPIDDVSAKHGSVVGTFKEDEIFYLMSKGISYNDTLKLLVRGYLFSSSMMDADVRKKIIDIINTYWR